MMMGLNLAGKIGTAFTAESDRFFQFMLAEVLAVVTFPVREIVLKDR
jgi:hypothetical protein